MPEEAIYSSSPINEWVRARRSRSWSFLRWIYAMKYPSKKAGMSGKNADNEFFTVRYDWDAEHGFHVNVIRGQERRLYYYDQVSEFDTELHAVQLYDTLTEKIDRLGEARAAEWFMDGDAKDED